MADCARNIFPRILVSDYVVRRIRSFSMYVRSLTVK